MNRQTIIKAAKGNIKADLVLKNGQIINVFTGEIIEGDLAVKDGLILGIGEYEGTVERDVRGKYICPGFINAHVHVESSMTAPEYYAAEELRQGTTTIITDPHEIGNVGGLLALRNILEAAKRTNINYYIMLPSCVPCTPFEHSGANLDAWELTALKNDPHILGLGEMMNFVGLLECDPDVLDKLEAFEEMIIDGHFPMGGGKALNAYVCAGVKTDHESITFEEALEKLRCGMAVLIREGSASRNLDAIIPGVIDSNIDTSRLAFCTDDKHLADIRRDGTIRYNIRRAIALGMDPVTAVRIGTLNAARIYGLKGIGALGCGYKADIVIVNDLESMEVFDVYKDGVPVSELGAPRKIRYRSELLSDVNCGDVEKLDFTIKKQDRYSVIGIIGGQIVTKKLEMSADELERGIRNGEIRKIAVIERHNATGFHSAAYIKGYGLSHGAIATTVAHDSHNIVMIGDNDADMKAAVSELIRIGGGYTIVCDGEVIGSLPLRLGGLMSTEPTDRFIPALDEIIRKAYDMGVSKDIDPFITLSFMALPVIPELRITDSGLFDVTSMSFVK